MELPNYMQEVAQGTTLRESKEDRQ